MGLQKYRADALEHTQPDGARCYVSKWLGVPSLAKIENCRWQSLLGEPRITAYVQGEPDTYFSQPAKCYAFGKVINGYITSDDGALVFHHCYY